MKIVADVAWALRRTMDFASELTGVQFARMLRSFF